MSFFFCEAVPLSECCPLLLHWAAASVASSEREWEAKWDIVTTAEEVHADFTSHFTYDLQKVPYCLLIITCLYVCLYLCACVCVCADGLAIVKAGWAVMPRQTPTWKWRALRSEIRTDGVSESLCTLLCKTSLRNLCFVQCVYILSVCISVYIIYGFAFQLSFFFFSFFFWVP